MISVQDVVIIGGGITGLAAAHTLEEMVPNIKYLLVEKDHRLGGKIITENRNGFLVEGGPDCYLSEKPSVTRLADQLGLLDQLIGTNDEHKGTFIFSNDRLHALPEGLMLMVPTKIVPFALSPLISWPGKIRMGLDFVLPKKKESGDETLKSFVVRRLGQEALDKIAEPLIGGIHGGDPETMSLKASFPRFLDMEAKYGSLIKAMLAARKRKKGQDKKPQFDGMPRTYFISFEKGMGQLVNALGDKLQGEIITGCQVVKIEKSQYGYRVFFVGGESVDTRAVILAVPAPEAAELFQPLHMDISETLSRIPMASSATISLAYRKDQVPLPPNSFGFLIPHVEQRKINAVTYTSVKWNHRVPDDSFILFRTFVGGAKNSSLAEEDENQILFWAQEELKKILGIKAKPVMASAHRWFRSRPQYTIGHLERIRTVEDYLKAFPGLYLAGGSYRGIGIPDCVQDGIRAATETSTFLMETHND